MIAFGPVPSRRLGRSLGINNIPPKICTFACVYCQLGRTIQLRIKRQNYYSPDEVFRAVQQKVKSAAEKGETIDYLTFVPDGEPTLDINLGREIELLRSLDIPIAVITNSSLIWQEDVRRDLLLADWVSLKIDAAEEDIWRQVDRPYHSLNFPAIMEGIQTFSQTFKGILATETMLIKNLNDDERVIRETAAFIASLHPHTAYLAVPTRPPAESYAIPPGEDLLTQAFHQFSQRIERVEYLIGYEGNAFAHTGNAREDILSITAVHPMRKDAVEIFLKDAGEDWGLIQRLIEAGDLVEEEFNGKQFYLRKLKKIKGISP